MSYWSSKRVMVTGASGFLGRHVVAALRRAGADQVFSPAHDEYDLVHREAIRRAFDDGAPEVVFHLAARVGGIGANRQQPAAFFYDNAMMGIQLVDEAARRQVEKLVLVGTVCAYPGDTPVPFREDDLWDGYPEPTNAPYGLAKRMLLVQAQAYRRQFGLNAIYLLPANLYGPGDHYDLETSHVVPALIRKCVEAREAGASVVELWGDGSATREFLYVEDAARALLLAAEHYAGDAPVNVGSGEETSIADLARLVGRLTGFAGEFRWDATRPNGQSRRRLDVSRAKIAFGFGAQTTLEDGLRRTVSAYDRGCAAIAVRENGRPGEDRPLPGHAEPAR